MNKIINKKITANLLAVMMITAFVFTAPKVVFASETEQNTPAYNLQIIELTLPDGGIVVSAPQSTTSPQLDSDGAVTEDPNAQVVTPDNYGTFFDGEYGSGDIENIEEYWYENGYPDYISYAHLAGGTMISDTEKLFKYEIGVVGMTEEIKAEILNLVGANCTVEFVECEYSYNQRNQAKEEILSWNDENISDVFLGLNTESVYIAFTNEITSIQLLKYNQTIEKEFAGMVEVISTTTTDDYEVSMGVGETTGIGGTTNNNTFYIAISLLLVAILGIFMYRKSQNAKALALSNGETKIETKISKSQVKNAIQTENIQPSDDVLDKILQDIKK